MEPVIRRPSNVEHRPRTTTRGLHYHSTCSNPVVREFVVTNNANLPSELPSIDTSVQFSNVNNIPVQSAVVSVDRHRYLVMGYFDHKLPQNLNLHEVFPHLAWHGEIVVFSLGRRTRILSRPLGARYMIHKAISLYIRGVSQARMGGGKVPSQISFVTQSAFVL